MRIRPCLVVCVRPQTASEGRCVQDSWQGTEYFVGAAVSRHERLTRAGIRETGGSRKRRAGRTYVWDKPRTRIETRVKEAREHRLHSGTGSEGREAKAGACWVLRTDCCKIEWATRLEGNMVEPELQGPLGKGQIDDVGGEMHLDDD